ncbi:hypothetical protein ACN079_01470 [Pseudomonas sp. ABY48]|uniref:hypothetical protein n=1 Tax=Pseudomonas sp. ABY48 TaxID=3402865 RepID=UPI003B437A3C
MPEETVLIQPLPIERDEFGFWPHPQWPSTDDELIPYTWFTERGLEVRETNFEYDAPEELQATGFHDGIPNCTAWEPSPSSGDGWFIFSIHDADDGPICV